MKIRIYPILILIAYFTFFEANAQCNTPVLSFSKNFKTQPDPNDIRVLPNCWEKGNVTNNAQKDESTLVSGGRLSINSSF